MIRCNSTLRIGSAKTIGVWIISTGIRRTKYVFSQIFFANFGRYVMWSELAKTAETFRPSCVVVHGRNKTDERFVCLMSPSIRFEEVKAELRINNPWQDVVASATFFLFFHPEHILWTCTTYVRIEASRKPVIFIRGSSSYNNATLVGFSAINFLFIKSFVFNVLTLSVGRKHQSIAFLLSSHG